jgi:hypothetical protein
MKAANSNICGVSESTAAYYYKYSYFPFHIQSNIDVKWDNRTPVIIGKISPVRVNRTPT